MSLHCPLVTLNTNTVLPIVGLGTFKIRGDDVYSSLEAAIEAGYRSFDTASVYGNEATIRYSLQRLLHQYKLKRSDIYITSKLGPRDQGSGRCRQACLQSLQTLGSEYLDLYLVHWPGTQKVKPDSEVNRENRRQSWMELEQLYREGRLKAIGVSNYTVDHMRELLADCTVKPAVLQIEHHPHLQQTELIKLCHQHSIHFQAYASLGTSTADNKILTDPVICGMAEKYNKTPAQLLLRWSVQQGIGVLPKSTNPKHIAENINIFDFSLTQEDIDHINTLHTDTHYCWDPSKVT